MIKKMLMISLLLVSGIGCAKFDVKIVEPVGPPRKMDITTSDGTLAMTILEVGEARAISDENGIERAPQGQVFLIVSAKKNCKCRSLKYVPHAIRVEDTKGNTYKLRGHDSGLFEGSIVSITTYFYGTEHDLYIFEVPEQAQICRLRFGKLPSVDLVEGAVVGISQEIHRDQEMAKERAKALEWIKAVTGEYVATAFQETLDDAIVTGLSMEWRIGWEITNDKKPYIAKWTETRCFQFEELSIEEARKEDFDPLSMCVYSPYSMVWEYSH